MANLIKKICPNRKALILPLGTGLVLSLIPLHFAQAAWWDDLISLFTMVADFAAGGATWFFFWPILIIILILAHIFPILAYIFFAIATGLLNWVSSDFFVSLPFTKGGVVGPGLEATTGLVNLAFILVLVFIAFATILRLQSYGLKKLLPKFLFMVLLINFVPVICGVVIDIANIVTDSFLTLNLGSSFLEIFGPATPLGSIVKDMAAAIQGDASAVFDIFKDFLTITGLIGKVLEATLATFFGFFAGFVILLYVILFVIRIVALWILVILAPIAWFCWILPATKSVFRMWWSYFLQWAFVGAIAGFFLWLGGTLLRELMAAGSGLNNLSADYIPGPGWVQPFTNIIINPINQLFVFGTVIALLLIGFFISIKTASGGTEAVLKWGQKIPGMLSQTRLGQKALGGLAGKAQKALKGVSPYMQRMEERAGRVPLLGKGLKPLATAVGRPLGWASKGLSMAAGPALIKYAAEREKITLPSNFEKWSGPRQEEWIAAKGLSSKDRLSAAAKMGSNLEYTSKEFQSAVQADAKSVFAGNNLSYADEAKSIAKTYGGDVVDEKTLKEMKGIGKTGTDRRMAFEEVEKDIKETAEHIKSSLSNDDLTIEAGLKLKYITKEDLDKDKAQALVKAKASLTADETAKFLRDTAAAANYIREFKAGDIGKMADTKSLSARTGLTLGNPNNLQKVIDEHGKAALRDVFEGRGGLNNLADSPDKLDKLYKTNSGMVRSLMNNPALQNMDWKGRNQMRDVYDKMTSRFDFYERRMQAHEILEKDADLARYNTLQNEIDGLKKDIGDLEAASKGPVSRNVEIKISEAKGKVTRAEEARKGLWDKKIAPDPKKKSNWERVQSIRNPKRKR